VAPKPVGRDNTVNVDNDGKAYDVGDIIHFPGPYKPGGRSDFFGKIFRIVPSSIRVEFQKLNDSGGYSGTGEKSKHMSKARKFYVVPKEPAVPT
jgi:hypothetical protein